MSNKFIICAAGLISACCAFPAIAQLQLVPMMSPEPPPEPPPGSPPVLSWPSRYVGCGEQVVFGVRYRNNTATPQSIAGWGADVEPDVSQGSLGSYYFTLVDGGASDGFISVPRSFDAAMGPVGDKVAGLAWPAAVGVAVNESIPLGFAIVQASYGFNGDIRARLMTTPGDLTEGVATIDGRFLQAEFDTELVSKSLLHFTGYRRSPADIADNNQMPGPDGAYTAGDITAFLSLYFAGHPLADVAGPNQGTVPDGVCTADDIIQYFAWYLAGPIETCIDGGVVVQCPCELPIMGRASGQSAASGARGGNPAGTSAPTGSGPIPSTALTPAEILAMQQLIDTLPSGAQREAMQAQLDARIGGSLPTGTPSTPPAPDDR